MINLHSVLSVAVFIMNVNSSMELSDFHHKEVLILNRLPVYHVG